MLTVANKQDRDARIELLHRHIEIFRDAGKLRCRQILTIEVVQDIEDGNGRHDDEVKLENRSAFDLSHLLFRHADKRVWQRWRAIMWAVELAQMFFCVGHAVGFDARHDGLGGQDGG